MLINQYQNDNICKLGYFCCRYANRSNNLDLIKFSSIETMLRIKIVHFNCPAPLLLLVPIFLYIFFFCLCFNPVVTPPPRISPPPAPSDKPTVAMMLYEKRKQDYMKRKEDQRKKEAQKNGQFVVPYMVIPQSMVITQPLLQGIQPAAAPSATTTKSMDRGSAPQTQKRIRKRTEKARALISVPELKGAKSSPKNKKACSQRICMKDEKNEVISQVPLSQPPPITCIVTSNGLLPSGGLGISVANQVPPQGMKPLTSNVSFVASPKSVAIKQNNSLITPINTAKGAESPSTVLYVTPNHSILVNPPPSVIGERTSSGLTTPTSIATNTNSKTSICSNSAGPIHSAAPLNSVHVLPFNKKHAHISSHCTTKPVRKILPAPASGNTGFSVTIPKNSISQNVTPFSPILQQSLPIFQICQPQIPRIIANTSVNPVVLPTPPASPSQQPTVHLLNSNSPVPKPAVSTSHRPGHAINFDPNLISIGEEVSQVKEWMNGRGGVMHSQLDISLPYLPPFVSSLTTLTTLLKCKADLKMCSLPLIYSTGESSREEDPEKAIRQLVAERLSNNPAYLLLKARFLSCFSLPAFLATVPPHRDSSKIILSQYSEEEEEMSPREHSDKGILKGDLLRTDGQGAVASEFSGIGTRQRNRNLNGQ
ncbi:hypothetical protein JZ751_001151 [Albula glossodonta]|uniref:Uncharacterized protein n=1 Tax=Albula glossodonta TaxID=121402 RepID=A0A8T2PT15_9TELE|nr:hypothetical protein JZ751_001151 [Albula glossodonta]